MSRLITPIVTFSNFVPKISHHNFNYIKYVDKNDQLKLHCVNLKESKRAFYQPEFHVICIIL